VKCVQNINALYQNCARWVLARDIKVVRASYWRDKEVMHSGYRCAKHDLPCDVAAHGKYGCTG
jgi:hypothetical protein